MSRMDLSAEGLGLRSEDFGIDTLRAALAELIAVLIFVFVGAGTVVVTINVLGSELNAAALTAIALAHGLAIAALVAATAKISGGHVNPAVTFSAVITGRMKLGPGLVYMAAQLVGAVLGALLLTCVLKDSFEGSLGAQSLNSEVLTGTYAGVTVEIILTFILVFTIFATAVDPRGLGNIAPLAIGIAVLIDHLVGVPLTGASMNPARSFGPALVAGEWDDQWVYWVGPLIGGGLAGLVYMFMFWDRNAED